MQELFTLILVAALVFFTIWFSRLSSQLHAGLDGYENTTADIEDIKENIVIVAEILARLPDLQPQFNMNTHPSEVLKPLVEMIVKKFTGEQSLITHNIQRDSEGRFDGTPQEQTKDAQTGQADGPPDAAP